MIFNFNVKNVDQFLIRESSFQKRLGNFHRKKKRMICARFVLGTLANKKKEKKILLREIEREEERESTTTKISREIRRKTSIKIRNQMEPKWCLLVLVVTRLKITSRCTRERETRYRHINIFKNMSRCISFLQEYFQKAVFLLNFFECVFVHKTK